ncbi:axin-2-like [Alosa sapidissima]|uniref:axin-2-like n=1 Tax=Alosa sapidissima TaxID=34773 RepID=UPI001C08E87B|nr:axin-2-like [Alosa sapidissima]XP_041958999.1 axin-2-like [Alosa sapidissima]XP_041959000.1 axin-2-like [Alosa sapidissima]XP_041959001.1 axin-2-like [Alosa sapidissima]XP_041959002.1 axin-2-like [Alosa sapidissima]XP_041959003.1 axin-2-like [Alosa sapidissima]XP_041959005.1 axin-2-like [Alosa sapidissima]
MSRALTDPIGSSFREDAPRPPVPGEEGEASCHTPSKYAKMRPQNKAKLIAASSSSSTPRRNEDGLGEPEGSASPDSPLARWTKSLHFLLGDQDGAHLFRTFLEREQCVDTLDFWFACNGFRQMDLKDSKTVRVAKAIYKRYIENNSIVAKQMKPATKAYIRDSIKKQQIDSAMFDQAQTEIQSTMEENAYQMFLTSDIYLEYVRTGCENAAYVNHGNLGSLKLMCGYLPPLIEDKEWNCNDLKVKALATVVGLSEKTLRATVSIRTTDVLEHACRSQRRGEPASPYFVNSGHVFVPATSANDSEISSDAMTDDSMSMTDSSVDGIPPYKLGSKKQLQREMHRSVKINGQVSLPHFPRTHRLPREMTPVEPSAFAAQLITRLEKLKKEQETLSSLEERLQQIQEEEERDESEVPGSSVAVHHPPHALGLLPSGSCEEDPQAILDEHLSRVLKTPGCQSPGVPVRYSPRSRSPDHCTSAAAAAAGLILGAGSPSSFGVAPAAGKGPLGHRQATKHIHHHYIHHHHAASPKTKEQIEAEAAQRVAQCLCPPTAATAADYAHQRCHSPAEFNAGRSSTLSKRPSKASDGVSASLSGGEGSVSPQLPSDGTDRSQNVWQWILESERQNRHKPHSTQGLKKSHTPEASSKTLPSRTPSWGGGGIVGGGGSHSRNHHPGHPFIQDPAMPPLPPPNTLAQLEEACRRLEEVSKPPKQSRHSVSSLQRDRSHPQPFMNGNSAPANPSLQIDEWKEPKKPCGGHNGAPAALTPSLFSSSSSYSSSSPGSELVVTYFFCGEEIPYRRMMKTHSLTLGHFKEQLRKKGSYRYYFKKASDEFECGAVFEEVWDDCTVLPMYEGKVLGKVERMD